MNQNKFLNKFYNFQNYQNATAVLVRMVPLARTQKMAMTVDVVVALVAHTVKSVGSHDSCNVSLSVYKPRRIVLHKTSY